MPRQSRISVLPCCHRCARFSGRHAVACFDFLFSVRHRPDRRQNCPTQGIDPGAVMRRDGDDRRAERRRDRRDIRRPPAGAVEVCPRDGEEEREPLPAEFPREAEGTQGRRPVNDLDNERGALPDGIAGDCLLRPRRDERADPRRVRNPHVAAPEPPLPPLDRHPGEVPDPRVPACQSAEERALPAVRHPNEQHRLFHDITPTATLCGSRAEKTAAPVP